MLKEETISHICCECPKLAQNNYKYRHDRVETALHWKLCQKYSIGHPAKWYEHVPEKVVENDQVKILWNFNN